MLRKILFWLHLATGCLAGAVILIMSVTGVLLTYERQIIAWLDRDSRAAPSADHGVRLPIGVLIGRVPLFRDAAPTAITVRADAGAPAELSLGRDHVILVDPYSGKVLGESAPRARAFFQQMENWHRWLAASPEHRTGARAVTGACNLGFLLLVLSGPFLWIPRRWSWQSIKAVTFFRGGLSGRAREFNWHNVIGIWCLIPLVVVVASGVVMSYPWANNLVFRLTGNEPPAAGGRPNEGGRPGPGFGSRNESGRPGQPKFRFDGMDALWERAERQVPGWQSVTLRLPPSGRGPLAFTIDTGNGGRPDQRSQLTLNRNAEVVRWEPFESNNAGRRLRSWLRFLHTGEAGGFAGQTIAGLASLGGAVLVWTGVCLAIRRLLRWRKRLKGQAAAAETAPKEPQGAEV